MRLQSRPIATLAALPILVAACAADQPRAAAPASPLGAAHGLVRRLPATSLAGVPVAPRGATRVATDPERLITSARGLYLDEASAAPRLAGGGFVAGATRAFTDGHRSARASVLRFVDAGAARAEAGRLAREAYRPAPGSLVCDLSRPVRDLAGVRGAKGLVVAHRTASGTTAGYAAIVFAEGRLAFELSATDASGPVDIAGLRIAARRARSAP